MSTSHPLLIACCLMLGAAAPAGADEAKPAAAAINFDRTIRPILSENCLKCHGPDAAERKAGLRLDEREQVVRAAESGEVPVTPGKPEASELVRRILADDPDEQMPPPESGKKLTDLQKQQLKQWIAEGANYEKHWSLVAPRRPPVPAIQQTTWPANPIDFFILERLEAKGLKPSPPADKSSLIRRLTLDLTGLPPTPAEVDAFLADESADSYEKLVERVLSSPHYGERMALEWLDAARFADTHGYHIDSGRDMSRWREWVIDAFNNNLAFDRFTVEQLAGDLLPGSTVSQKIASGFNRNHMINFEGGAIPEEYHNAYIVDRVNTTATVWLGLTVACCQCHDHKYDPLTQKEFYQLYAFFHNVPENGLDGSKGNAAPLLPAPTAAQERKLADLAAEIKQREAQLAGPLPEVDAAQAAWEQLAAAEKQTVWQTLEIADAKSAGGAELKRQDDQSLLATGANPANETYTLTARVNLKKLSAIRLEGLADDSLPVKGPGRSANGNVVMTDVRLVILPSGDNDKAQTIALTAASADFSQANFPVDYAIDANPGTGWAIHPQVGKSHWAVFSPAAPVELPEGAMLSCTLQFKSQFSQHQFGRVRLSVTDAVDPHAAAPLPAEVAAILAIDAKSRTPQQLATLQTHYRQQVSPQMRAAKAELEAARKSHAELLAAVPTAMVMQEMPQPRDTFMLVRGQYDKRGDKVTAAVPAALPPLPAGAPANRLGLAQWLIDKNHPLTARVIVNRYWQMYFGNGLVKTSEDFGSQGEHPSHPELLDWLATEFVASGWDVKQMQRLIVTSATYRQSSATGKESLAADPENRLLSHAPRLRLPAEMIRDQALAASGLLNREIGGRSVSPYQPPGLWEELASRADGANWTAQTYTQSHGKDLYRRTMYTYWKRTSPPPTLATFDAPDRETCTVRRARTNTPLQALVLMNDPTYVEAARKLAERVLVEAPATPAERLTLAFRLVVAREPKQAEIKLLLMILDEQLAIYRADAAAAKKLLSVGESPASDKLAPAELAAWAIVSSVILNLDEAVNKT